MYGKILLIYVQLRVSSKDPIQYKNHRSSVFQDFYNVPFYYKHKVYTVIEYIKDINKNTLSVFFFILITNKTITTFIFM